MSKRGQRITLSDDFSSPDSKGTSPDSAITNIPDSLTLISFSPDSGKAGTQVQIVGSGFDTIANKSLVLINTTIAKVISATKTVLTVQVADGSTTGKITVIAYGKKVVSHTNFTVLKDSVPPNSNTWIRKADESLDDTLSGRNYREVWEYNSAQDKWTQKRNFPGAPRVVPFSFAVNGYGYMGGGDTTNANYDMTYDFWQYDPAADSWKRLHDFPA